MELSVMAVTFPMTCCSLPWANAAPAASTTIATNRIIRFIFVLPFLVMHLLHLWCFTFVEKPLFVFFLRAIRSTLRVELFHFFHFLRSHLGQVPDKENQSPTVVVPVWAAPGGHSGEPDTVVDDGIHLPVREVLCFGL